MKTLVYTLTVLMTFASCRSIEKMVDKGEYDKAILFAAKKLHGEKEPKTKYVMGLEEAYAKVTQRDVDQISYLMKSGRTDQWDEIYSMYLKMEDRQNRISPFLPLISKDGYQATFRFLDLADLKTKAAKNAAEYHYTTARELMARNDRLLARRAYNMLGNIDRYFANYKDANELRVEARHRGTTRVAVEVVNNVRGYVPYTLDRRLRNLNLSRLDSRWVHYLEDAAETADIAYRAIIEVTDIEVSSGDVLIDRFTETAEIAVKPSETQMCKRDTLAKVKREDQLVSISADVIRTRLAKDAVIRGYLTYYDVVRNRKVSSEPIEATANFRLEGARYDGDRRALSANTKSILGSVSRYDMPSDEQLLTQASDQLKDSVLRYMRKDNINI